MKFLFLKCSSLTPLGWLCRPDKCWSPPPSSVRSPSASPPCSPGYPSLAWSLSARSAAQSFLFFLVANSNSSFYSVLSLKQSCHTSTCECASYLQMRIRRVFQTLFFWVHLKLINIFLLVSVGGEELVVLGREIEVVEARQEEHQEECEGQVGRVGEERTVDQPLHGDWRASAPTG